VGTMEIKGPPKEEDYHEIIKIGLNLAEKIKQGD